MPTHDMRSDREALTGRSQIAYVIATTGGLGDRLPAPGTTAGSLPAAIGWLAVGLVVSSPAVLFGGLAIAVAVSTIVGLWAAGAEARRRSWSDPGPVVVDEVAGQWVCYLVTAAIVGADRSAGVTSVAAGFFTFRLLDVWKPWPIRRLERLPGGLGIMADDLLAGAAAGALVGLGLHLAG